MSGTVYFAAAISCAMPALLFTWNHLIHQKDWQQPGAFSHGQRAGDLLSFFQRYCAIQCFVVIEGKQVYQHNCPILGKLSDFESTVSENKGFITIWT